MPSTFNRRLRSRSRAIHWGTEYSGRATWSHFWGAWVLHQAGTYQVTVTLDSADAVAELDESDNSMTAEFSGFGRERV